MAELMELRGMSSRQLATASRVPVNSVLQSVKKSGTQPSIGKLMAYARALGVTLDALFGESAVDRLITEVTTELQTNQGVFTLDSTG